jgi:tRNA splicing ligase
MSEKLGLVSAYQLVRGAGRYEESDIADAAFDATTPDGIYQVHGHRNRYKSPTQVNLSCFNLEGSVEFAGELRTVTLRANTFMLRPIQSQVDGLHTLVETMPGAKNTTITTPESIARLVVTLRGSRGIFERVQDNAHISSFNFARDVFYKKLWDELTVHARGLFINTHTNQIVARSYDKFFNVDERPETKRDVLRTRLRYPVHAWVKENGFLGIVGYDPETCQLIFASKSTMGGDFAGWMRQQFDNLAPEGSTRRRELELYLSEAGGRTLLFEVIEPQYDPHIVDYTHRELVLLEVVINGIDFVAESKTEHERIAALLGCRVKRQAALLKDAATFDGWYDAVHKFDYCISGKHVEGFVLEDAAGWHIKVKLPWYGFWRQMRTQLQRIQNDKKPQLPQYLYSNELAETFIEFMQGIPKDELATANIVDLRNRFYKNYNVAS